MEDRTRPSHLVMPEIPKPTHLNYKIVVMGDEHCGKSSLITRFVKGGYNSNYTQSVGRFFRMSYNEHLQCQQHR